MTDQTNDTQQRIEQARKALYPDDYADDHPTAALTDREVAEMAQARFEGASRFEICDEFGVDYQHFVELEKTDEWLVAYEDAEIEYYRHIEAKARAEIEAGIDGDPSFSLRVAERLNHTLISPPQKGEDPDEWAVTATVHARQQRKESAIDRDQLDSETIHAMYRARCQIEQKHPDLELEGDDLLAHLPDDLKQRIVEDLEGGDDDEKTPVAHIAPDQYSWADLPDDPANRKHKKRKRRELGIE